MFGNGTDPERLQTLQSTIDEEERKRFPIAGERNNLIDLLNEYREYNHAEAVRYPKDLEKELETIPALLEKAEARLAGLEETSQSRRTSSQVLSQIFQKINNLKDRILFLKNREDKIIESLKILPSENQERLDTAKARVKEFEGLVSRYREEYEQAGS